MKKLLIGLVTMMCLLGVVGVAYGNSGQAIIPTVITHTSSATVYWMTSLRISNITNEPIDVKITIYDENGIIIAGSNYISSISNNITNYNTNPTNATVSFTLGSHETVPINFRKTTVNTVCGYGIIEWSQDSKAVNGLVAYGFNRYFTSDTNSMALIPINNGLPF